MTKLAAVAMGYHPTDMEWNLNNMVKWVKEAAAQGAELVVLPEECVSGLGTRGMNEFFPPDRLAAMSHAELVPEGPACQCMIELAKELDIYIVWSMCEQDPDRWSITHNACVLVGPEGYIGKYRKIHFPLAERMFHVAGTEYCVFDTRIGKIGLSVCYDICFPEVARILAIKGADIIVCPTGWPNISQTQEDPDNLAYQTFAAARALENMVFVVQSCVSNSEYSDPVFNGQSHIYGPNPGQLLARVEGFGEGVVVADVDIKEEIRHARVCSMGGDDLVKDRRPSTYGLLLARPKFGNYSDGFYSEEEAEDCL